MPNIKVLIGVIAVLLGGTIGGWSLYLVEKRDGERDRVTAADEQTRLNTEIGSLTQSIEELTGRHRELERRHEGLAEEHAVLGDKHTALTRQYESLGERHASLSRARDELDESYRSLSNAHEDLTGVHTTLQSQAQGLEARLSQTVEERDTLDETLAEARAEQRRVEGELSQVEQRRVALRAEIEKAETERAELQARLATTGKDLEAKLGQIARAEMSIADLNERLEAAGREEKEKLAEVERFRGQVAELGRRLESASARVVELESRVARLEQEKQQTLTQLGALQARLREELKTRDVQIERLRGDLTLIRIGGDILFNSGSVEFTERGRVALELIAETLNEKFPDHFLSLEGHTDDIPISYLLRERYPTNWELSSARASRAIRRLETLGVDPKRMRAVGYAEHQPTAVNDDVESRARNRRIELLLLPHNPRIVSPLERASQN
jgi:chemotaxis protein MotB